MRRANAIQKETEQISTVEDLTGVFESVSSTQVAKVRNKVALSKEFFDLLWKRYRSIRIDPNSRITKRGNIEKSAKQVFVIISAEAGLSGDIDDRLIEVMLHDYDENTTDIVVLGSHGATELKQNNIPYIRYFQVPESTNYVDVGPIVKVIKSYSKIKVFYEEYVSLGVQDIKSIDLITSIQNMSKQADGDSDEEIITAVDTVFEPSLEEIAEQMEATIMSLALSQTILESNLAQNASRFNAMAGAKKRAKELVALHMLEFHRAKRSEGDRRLREVMVSLKKKKHRQHR